MVFHNVWLLCIIKKNSQLKFEMAAQVCQWMDKIPWYKTTISTKLHGQIFEDYLKTGRKYRYALVFFVNVYDIDHVPMTCDASSGVGIPIPIISSKEAIYSLCQKTKFIDSWIQCFEVSYDDIIMIYKRKVE